MLTVDTLIQSVSGWTPREAVLFLLKFDRAFLGATGRAATKVEEAILTGLLRQRALADR